MSISSDHCTSHTKSSTQSFSALSISPTMVNLPRSTPPSYYLDGMDLGKGIDAITGEITQGAFDASFTKEDVESSQSSDTFSFRSMADMTELQSSQALGFAGSVTFPDDGVKVGGKKTLDFSNSDTSSTSVLLIVLDWERCGSAKRVGSDAKLSADAKAVLSDDKTKFRNNFGDFFVYQLLYMIKFTAVWYVKSLTL